MNREWHVKFFGTWIAGVVVFVGLAALLLLPGGANWAANQTKRGNLPPLASGFFDRDLWGNPLSLHAEDVRLVWVDGSPPAGLGVRPGGTFTYLGRSSDTLVIYDRAQHRTIRVPASSVVLVNSVKKPTANP